jgi:sugar lactone lactonase YvrE
MRVEQVTDPIAYHAEGPVWSPVWGGLRWVDMLAGDVLSLADDGTVTRHHVGDVAAAIRPRRQGGAIIGVERGFALEDADGTVTVVLTGVTVSNGLEWSPDGAHAYYNDTPTQRIAVLDYDPGSGLRGQRTFVTIPAEAGRPDGLTVDAQGGVWVALNNGGAVRRYSPAGALDEVIELPARKVTACTFGGPHLDELFITTSRENLEPAEDPLAGSLFRARVDVTGLAVREFAG